MIRLVEREIRLRFASERTRRVHFGKLSINFSPYLLYFVKLLGIKKSLIDNDKASRAGDRVRTGDIQLGRLTLYQLSYSRNFLDLNPMNPICQKTFLTFVSNGPSGESRIRTCEGENQQIYSLSSLAA